MPVSSNFKLIFGRVLAQFIEKFNFVETIKVKMNMKKLLFLAVVMIGMTSFAQEENSLKWHTNLETAIALSKEQSKPILIYFTGSDWCAPCKMLKADFWNSDEFGKRAEKFVLVMADEPRRMDIITPEQRTYNRKLAKKYNPEGSYPNIVALNHKGKVLGGMSGYTMLRETDKHFDFVDGVLKNY